MDTDFGAYSNVNAMDTHAPGGVNVTGGGLGMPTSTWGLIGAIVVLVLVLIVVWRFSNFRQDRVCISTDLRDYWPSGYIQSVPRLPGQDYLPRLSYVLPAENVVAARDKWTVNDNLLSSVIAGN